MCGRSSRNNHHESAYHNLDPYHIIRILAPKAIIRHTTYRLVGWLSSNPEYRLR